MPVSALTRLAGALQPFSAGLDPGPDFRGWVALHEMDTVLARVRQRHGGSRVVVARRDRRAFECVTGYLASGEVAHPDDVALLCLGTAWLDEAGRGILADRVLREKLLGLAETLPGRTRRLKAFRHLLQAYWRFPLYGSDTLPEAVAGWESLREWLRRRQREIDARPGRKPGWFRVIQGHLDLLGDRPCERYAESLLNGRMEELQAACNSLSIPADSWVREAALLAQVDAASRRPDASFLALLPDLLATVRGGGGFHVSPTVARRMVGRLLVRYSRLSEPALHEDIFLLALECIGNPWQRQALWDEVVIRADGTPCATSREMVAGWLKERRIVEFFAAAEGPDQHVGERCMLWQRYAVFMPALTLAQPWGRRHDPALLLRLGAFVVLLPRSSGTAATLFRWQQVMLRGGARLFEGDSVDGVVWQRVLDHCKPVVSLAQGDPAGCDASLRGLLFSTAG